MKSYCALFAQALSWRPLWRTLIIIIWFTDLLIVQGAYLTDDNFPCHNSFFVYTFCRLLDFGPKLNMTFQDFRNTQSGHNSAAEIYKCGLLWKLSKIFGFHRNQCKMQIIKSIVTWGWCLLFQNQMHQFTGYAQFFHFMLFLLSKIVF